jgi:hypothetical protein
VHPVISGAAANARTINNIFIAKLHTKARRFSDSAHAARRFARKTNKAKGRLAVGQNTNRFGEDLSFAVPATRAAARGNNKGCASTSPPPRDSTFSSRFPQARQFGTKNDELAPPNSPLKNPSFSDSVPSY